MFLINKIQSGEDISITFSGTDEEKQEFISLLDEKVIEQTEEEDGSTTIKITWWIWQYDGKDTLFYFTKRPYFHLRNRILERKSGCWFNITKWRML